MTLDEQRTLADLLRAYGWLCNEPQSSTGSEFLNLVQEYSYNKVTQISTQLVTRLDKKVRKYNLTSDNAVRLGKWLRQQEWMETVYCSALVRHLCTWVGRAKKEILDPPTTKLKIVEEL